MIFNIFIIKFSINIKPNCIFILMYIYIYLFFEALCFIILLLSMPGPGTASTKAEGGAECCCPCSRGVGQGSMKCGCGPSLCYLNSCGEDLWNTQEAHPSTVSWNSPPSETLKHLENSKAELFSSKLFCEIWFFKRLCCMKKYFWIWW